MSEMPAASPTPSHVVGIGASAGGLDAIERLFDNLPGDTGMSFVIVQHLSPDFKSMMDELSAAISDSRFPIAEMDRLEDATSLKPGINCPPAGR